MSLRSTTPNGSTSSAAESAMTNASTNVSMSARSRTPSGSAISAALQGVGPSDSTTDQLRARLLNVDRVRTRAQRCCEPRSASRRTGKPIEQIDSLVGSNATIEMRPAQEIEDRPASGDDPRGAVDMDVPTIPVAAYRDVGVLEQEQIGEKIAFQDLEREVVKRVRRRLHRPTHLVRPNL